MSKPNLLLIMTDQQRFDSIGPYGCDCIPTPAFDRLAAEGRVYERCYVNNPICTPSRCSILTGLELPGHGVYRLHDNLLKEQGLFPSRLQREGYRTALFGKLHICGRVKEARERHPNDGFETYEWCVDPALHLDSPFNAYARWLREEHPDFYARLEREGREARDFPLDATFTHWAAERTMDYLRERERDDEPFFCMMSVFDPHDPYFDCPKADIDSVDPNRLPPPVPGESLNRIPKGLARERAQYHGDRARTMRERREYFGEIAMFDRELGRVLDMLDETGLAENTLVVFLSDHGDMLGDHGLGTKGGFFYEPCVRVPLLLRWPGVIPAGTREEKPVQPHDVAATFLAAAGVSEAERKAAMPTARGLIGSEAGHPYVISLYRNSGYGGSSYFDPPLHASMICDGHWKLISYADEGEPERAGQLFDLECDPLEQNDRYTDPACRAERERLAARLTDWMIQNDARYCGSRGGESPVSKAVYLP